jgi:6-pyruvoyl-tetrahydropterin synthase
MMTKISKRFDFDAAHFLPNVPGVSRASWAMSRPQGEQ